MLRVLPLLALLRAAAGVEDVAPKGGSPAPDEAGLSQSQVSSANEAESDFWHRAKTAIAGLHDLEAEQEREVSNRTRAAIEAQSIVDAAKKAYHDRQVEAEHEFDTRLKALNPNATNVRSAAEAARSALHLVRDTTRGEIKEMRRDLRSRHRADRARARDLLKQAREATDTGRRFAHSFAHAMQKAGGPEERSEQVREDASVAAERLRLEAEVSFEHSHDLTEQRWDGVHEELEGLVDHLEDEASSARMAQEDALKRAEAAAREPGEQSLGSLLPSQPPVRARLLPTSVLYVAMAGAILASFGILVSRPRQTPALDVEALG